MHPATLNRGPGVAFKLDNAVVVQAVSLRIEGRVNAAPTLFHFVLLWALHFPMLHAESALCDSSEAILSFR